MAAGGTVAADPVRVFAAASLRGVLDEVIATSTMDVSAAYAGSAALARQIAAGAPADIFISANVLWMDALADDGVIDPETRQTIAENTLVLAGDGWQAAPQPLDGPAVVAAVGGDRLAMALVDAVPAGIYGKEALLALGVWDELAPQVVQSDNVRTALALVARGEAPFGIVYATDAAASADVGVVGPFPPASHAPIEYPAALVVGAAPEAATFLAHLQSDDARAILAAHGFVLP